ncbi:MAG: thioredoxin domain-containing protein [Acidobacteriia bacterium]|nr:thioredoxin domain-containing protein [Terriglobia bacterium]
MRKSLSLALSLLGLFDSLYLLWTYTSPSRPMVCLGTGCDAVRASAYSSLWGVPMPVFGVAGYALLAIVIVAESLASARLAQLARYALAGMTGVGFLVSLYLEYLQSFVIHAFCTWCVTSGLVMTALCGLAVYSVVRAAPEPEPPAQLAQVRSHFAVCVAALLAGVPAFYLLARHGELPAPPPQATSETLAEKLVRPDSHVAGNPQAPVTVVEFGDFECPVCVRGEEAAREIRTHYASQVRFVFRQFPLVRIHPRAEKAAEASECAAEQGKFWEGVDKIYSRQSDLSDDGLMRDAAELGLDQARFNQCFTSGSTTGRIRQDLADGKALGVDRTPTFFIGQKRIEGALPVAEFSQLVDQELASRAIAMPKSIEPPAALAPPKQRSGSAAARISGKPAPGKVASEPGQASRGLLGTAPGGFFAGFQASSAAACSEAEAAKKQPTMIDSNALRQLLASNPKPLFVDVRPAKDYAAGRIPSALNVPVDDIEQRWSSLPKDRVIVLYESGRSSGDICAASRTAGRILLEHGFPFEQVKVYQDGLAGWEKSGPDAH